MASCDLDFDLENDLNTEILARLRAAVSDSTSGEANDIEEHNEPLQTVRCQTVTNNIGAVQCDADTSTTNGLPTIAPPVQCIPDTSTNGLPTVASIDGDSVVSGRSSRSEGNRRPSLQDHRSNGFLELPNDLLNFYSTVTQISPNNNTACHLGSGISDSSTDDVAIGSTNTDDVDIGALNITETSMKDKQQTEAIGDCSLIDLDSGDASCDNVSYPGHNSMGNRRVRRSLGASTSHVTSAVSSVVDLPYKSDVLPVEASDPTHSADCTTRSDSFDGGAQRPNQSAGNVTPRMAQRSRNIVNRSHSVASCSDMHHRRTPPTVPCSRSSSMKSSPPPAYRRHDPHLTLNNLPSYTASTPPLASNTQSLPVAQPAYYPQHSPSYQRHAPTSRGHQSPASHTSPGSPATSRCTAVNNSLSASSPVQYSATYQRSPGNTASFHHHGTAAHVGGPHGGVQRPISSPAGCHFSPRSPGGAAMRTGSGTGSPQLARASMSDYLPSYEEAVGLVPPRGTQTPPNQPASSQPASPPPNDSPVATATSPPTTRCGNSSSTKLPSPPSVQPPPGPINEPPLGYAPLQFKDFTPQVVGAFFPVWEKFDVLIGRANQWLYSTHGIRVRRCESVLGMAARSHGYNPSRAIGTVSKINSDYTYNMRFLRVWYETGGSSGMVSKLIYRNLTASNMLATTSVLIALLNRDIKHAQWMNGTLVSIESVALPLKQLSHPDDCVYVERVGDVIPMAYFLRVFGVQTFDDGGQVPPVPIGTVGFLDFVPQESQSGGPHNVEPFSMLIRKVNSWMTHERPRVHLLNIQSMQVKRKANQSSYWQRLHYTYYASDKRTLRKTFFTQIVRVYFMTSPCLYTIPVNDPQPITYKVFTPVQLTSPKSEELKFESLEKTVERIHIWLSFQSGLRVISMETVSVRMYTGGQDRHGPETCLSWCEGRTYSDHEHWINCIRLYMRGSYRELEPWQLPIEPNVRPYTNCQPPASITLIRPTIVFP